MWRRDVNEAEAVLPDHVSGIMIGLDQLAKALAANGEDKGAQNVRIALDHLNKSRTAMRYMYTRDFN